VAASNKAASIAKAADAVAAVAIATVRMASAVIAKAAKRQLKAVRRAKIAASAKAVAIVSRAEIVSPVEIANRVNHAANAAIVRHVSGARASSARLKRRKGSPLGRNQRFSVETKRNAGLAARIFVLAL